MNNWSKSYRKKNSAYIKCPKICPSTTVHLLHKPWISKRNNKLSKNQTLLSLLYSSKFRMKIPNKYNTRRTQKSPKLHQIKNGLVNFVTLKRSTKTPPNVKCIGCSFFVLRLLRTLGSIKWFRLPAMKLLEKTLNLKIDDLKFYFLLDRIYALLSLIFYFKA